jgi:hypothetical protein
MELKREAALDTGSKNYHGGAGNKRARCECPCIRQLLAQKIRVRRSRQHVGRSSASLKSAGNESF